MFHNSCKTLRLQDFRSSNLGSSSSTKHSKILTERAWHLDNSSTLPKLLRHYTALNWKSDCFGLLLSINNDLETLLFEVTCHSTLMIKLCDMQTQLDIYQYVEL